MLTKVVVVVEVAAVAVVLMTWPLQVVAVVVETEMEAAAIVMAKVLVMNSGGCCSNVDGTDNGGGCDGAVLYSYCNYVPMCFSYLEVTYFSQICSRYEYY